jgi:hypothetical protein
MAGSYPRRPYVVLTLFGRCGSLFLHSLFDGHPLLSSIPGIAPYGVLGEAAQSPAVLAAGPDEQARVLAARFAHFFNTPLFREDAGLDRLGAGGDEVASIDAEAFRGHAHASLAARQDQAPLLRLCEAMHDAFDLCVLGGTRPRGFLQLHALVPTHSAAIIDSLPQRKVLFLARSPVENIESCVNALLIREPVQRSRLTKLYNIVGGMLALQAGQPYLDEGSLAVRFEDLKKAPQEVLRAICGFAGLPFDDALLSSTYMGRAYQSPPTRRNPGIRGFAAPSAAPSGYRLGAKDRAFFAALFRGLGERLGYDMSEAAPAALVEALVTRHFLDLELEFARHLGLADGQLARQPDTLGFRQQLASMPGIFGGPACGVRSAGIALGGAATA